MLRTVFAVMAGFALAVGLNFLIGVVLVLALSIGDSGNAFFLWYMSSGVAAQTLVAVLGIALGLPVAIPLWKRSREAAYGYLTFGAIVCLSHLWRIVYVLMT